MTAVETSDGKRAENALRHLNQTLEVQVADRVRERDELWRVSRDLARLTTGAFGLYQACRWTRSVDVQGPASP
jgi:hypothetical protein